MKKPTLDLNDLQVSSFTTQHDELEEGGGTYFPECMESFSICKTCYSCGYTDCACTNVPAQQPNPVIG